MSKYILIPTQSCHDWQRFLAKPELHWKPGYSAMTLARAWEAGEVRGFPREIASLFHTTPHQELKGLSLVFAMPEYQVSLPGGRHPSQTDLLVMACGPEGLVIIAVEGKVNESFGPTVADKRKKRSNGVAKNLECVMKCLGLDGDVPDTIRYQLLHRTASAFLVAQKFHAHAAVMLVHSFSPSNKWFDDFSTFARLFGAQPNLGELVSIGKPQSIPLFIGWCCGDQCFREPEETSEKYRGESRDQRSGGRQLSAAASDRCQQ